MAVTIQNYTTLVSAIVNYFEDDSVEFKAHIPTAIDLAEQRLVREIDTYGLVTNSVVSTTSATRLLSKPNGYIFGFNIEVVLSNGEERNLQKSTASYCKDYWPWANTSVGTPKYYADYSDTQWILAPTPKDNGPVNLSYASRPSGVSTGVSTNYFTKRMPDTLYYASLIEMAKFGRQNSMLQSLEASYQNSIQTIIGEGRRERRDEGMEPASPSGNRNNLLSGN